MAEVEDRFSSLLGDLDYPMYVVTTSHGGERAGCLVGFATQVSIDPPRFLVCLSEKNHTRVAAADASYLAVHFLGFENVDLAHLFGEETGDEIDKFTRCRWTQGPFDMPVLDDAEAWFIGRILERFDVGDHLGHLLEPVHVERRGPIVGMISYADVRDFDPGHEA